MKKEPITVVIESIAHEEFIKVAGEVRTQLKAGNRVILEVAPGVSELSVRSLLIGRYIHHTTATKLVIKKQN